MHLSTVHSGRYYSSASDLTVSTAPLLNTLVRRAESSGTTNWPLVFGLLGAGLGVVILIGLAWSCLCPSSRDKPANQKHAGLVYHSRWAGR